MGTAFQFLYNCLGFGKISINLSRSDFDTCDIVEEIIARVDASGIGRDKLTIEITESAVGADFEFIKKQVNRFREQGFAVWMDDFGSGYSSIDLLQSMEFDLIKFDMSFMQRLDEGNNGKIILTELMKMATALGVDTLCEGVETEEQLRFLQEIGCAKLQGYYYCKPITFETYSWRVTQRHPRSGSKTPKKLHTTRQSGGLISTILRLLLMRTKRGVLELLRHAALGNHGNRR